MRWNTTIELIATTSRPDEVKNQITEESASRVVYANLMRMRFSAKVAAAIDDYNKIKVFEILTIEYSGEERLIFENKDYEILDIAPKGDRTVITAKLSRRSWKNG